MSADATRTVASRVAQVRRRRGWSTTRLAQKCAEVGMPGLNRAVLANLQSGRRTFVTVDEVLALAFVLNVAPVHLLVPIEQTADHQRYRVTATRDLPLAAAREWVRGRCCPPGRDPRSYYSEVPPGEW